MNINLIITDTETTDIMTSLQRLAFDRVNTLCKDTIHILPRSTWKEQEEITIEISIIKKILSNLYEQQDLIESLLEEEVREQ